MMLAVDLHNGGSIGIVGPTVFALGADDHYIVVKQHPAKDGFGHFDQAVTDYFIVTRLPGTAEEKEKGVRGPPQYRPLALGCLGSQTALWAEDGERDRLTDSPWCSQRIEDLDARKVLFVIGYDYAIVHFGDGSDDHIQVASGFSDGATFRHKTSPDQCRLLVKRQYSSFE
jgi:hypothetical protein